MQRIKQVNPNDLKIGDKIKYISYKSVYSSECNDDNCYLEIGKIYKVYDIQCISHQHMARAIARRNPILLDETGKHCGSAWWGTFEYLDKYEDFEPKRYGIVKFLESVEKGTANV